MDMIPLFLYKVNGNIITIILKFNYKYYKHHCIYKLRTIYA